MWENWPQLLLTELLFVAFNAPALMGQLVAFKCGVAAAGKHSSRHLVISWMLINLTFHKLNVNNVNIIRLNWKDMTVANIPVKTKK